MFSKAHLKQEIVLVRGIGLSLWFFALFDFRPSPQFLSYSPLPKVVGVVRSIPPFCKLN